MLDTFMMCPRLRSIIPLDSSLVNSTCMLVHALRAYVIGLISSSATLELQLSSTNMAMHFLSSMLGA